jgi:hypothetical protein
MDIYHVWCDLRPGVRDTRFHEAVAGWMEHLRADGLIENWRLTRRKLGLGPAGLGEWHLMIEVRGLAQLDEAFQLAATRAEPAEGLHHAVNSLVTNATFGLARDFPDPLRRQGEERF